MSGTIALAAALAHFGYTCIMWIRRIRLLGLASILVVAYSSQCLGQSLTSGLEPDPASNLATPLASSPTLSSSSGDQTGASVSGQASQNSLSSISAISNVAASTGGGTAQSAAHGSANRAAGASQFAMSPAFNTEAEADTKSAFGVSSATFRTEMTAAKPSASNDSFGELQKQSGKSGHASPTFAKQTVDTAKAAPDVHNLHSLSAKDVKAKGLASISGSTEQSDEENSAQSTTGVSVTSGNASYSVSFPDSTEGTALVSPPVRNDPPFRTLPDELAFGFVDLNETSFLDPSFKEHVAGGRGGEKESMYQRFLKHMQAERNSAAPSNGIRANSPLSPFSTSALGLSSQDSTGIKTDSTLGQRSGLRSSMPF